MKKYCPRIKIDRGLLSPIYVWGLFNAFKYMYEQGLDLKMYRDAGGVWVRIN